MNILILLLWNVVNYAVTTDAHSNPRRTKAERGSSRQEHDYTVLALMVITQRVCFAFPLLRCLTLVCIRSSCAQKQTSSHPPTMLLDSQPDRRFFPIQLIVVIRNLSS